MRTQIITDDKKMKLGLENIFNKIKTERIIPLISICLFASLLFFSFCTPTFAADPGQAEKFCPLDGAENKVFDPTENCTPPMKCNEPGCIDTAPADNINRVSGTVGIRDQSYDADGKPVGSTGHKGTDYAAEKESAIYAAADGVVETVKYNFAVNPNGVEIGYGNYVVIRHANGMRTVYAHMNCWAEGLAVGQTVKKGQVIGFVGNTGGSTGPHLHVEYRMGGSKGEVIDPLAQNDDKYGLCNPPEKFKHTGETPGSGGGTGGGGTGGGGGAGGGSSGGAGSASGPTGSPEHPDKDCDPRIFRAGLKECLFCDLFKIAFNTSSDIAKKSYEIFAKPVANVVAIVFALWIAFFLIKFLATLKAEEPKRFFKELLNKSFVVLFVIVLLNSDSSTFMGLALEPIFNTGFKLAMMSMQGDFTTCSNDYGIISDGGLPASMGNNIICTIKIIQDKLLDVFTIGTTSMCVAVFVKNFYVFPHMGYLIAGLAIWVGALLLLFIFPFLMLDSVLHLAVACALLPAAIGAYAFESTSKYVKKIWETFLHSMFQFVFLTIVLMIIFKAIKETLKDVVEGDIKNEFINDGRWEKLLLELSWTGISFLQLVFILLLGWAVLGQISEFAKSFSSSLASGGIGSKLGGMAASAAKNTFKKAVMPGLQIVGKDIKNGVNSTVMQPLGGVISRGAAAVRGKAFDNKAFQKIRGIKKTTNASGDSTYSYKSWLLRRDKTRIVGTENGEDVVTETKTYGSTSWARNLSNTIGATKTELQNNINKGLNTAGNAVRGVFELEQKEFKEKEFEAKQFGHQSVRQVRGNMEVNIVNDGTGQQISKNVEFTDPKLQKLLYRDKIDTAKINELRTSYPQSVALINEAVMMQAMEKRMPGSMSKNVMLRNIKDQGTVEVSKDANGNEVMQMTKIEDNGTKHIYKMITDAQGHTTTVYEKARSNGKVEILKSNGLMNSKTTVEYDKNGEEKYKSRKTTYAFAKHITRNHSELPVDYYGRTAGHAPSKERLGLDDSEWDALVKQYQKDRKNQPIAEFAD